MTFEELHTENETLKAQLATALSNVKTAEAQRDQYKKSFETQQVAHEESMNRTKALSKVVGRPSADAIKVNA